MIAAAATVALAAPPASDLDTDMGGAHVDDVVALCIAHALVDNGEAELLAMASLASPLGDASAISVINHWYGRDDMPIGAYKGTSAHTGRRSTAAHVCDSLVRTSPRRAEQRGGAGRARRVPQSARRLAAGQRGHFLRRSHDQPRGPAALRPGRAQPADGIRAGRGEGDAACGDGRRIPFEPAHGPPRMQRLRLLQWRRQDLAGDRRGRGLPT